jgi:hypothetical protein
LIGLVLLILIGMGYSLYAIHRESTHLEREVRKLSHIVEEHPIELATFMASYERFAQKLYLAGQAQNWDLAAFYHEELEETAEQLKKLNLTDDGVPVSAMMDPNLLTPLKAVEAAIQRRDPNHFGQAFQQLIQHCNSCHQASGKPYIQLRLTAEGLRQHFTSQTK